MKRLLRSLCWVVAVGCLQMACGSETPPDRGSPPPPPPPPPTLTITPDAQTLAVGETVTLRAVVSGNDKTALVWSPSCESGRVAVAVDSLGTSATITATRAGICAVTVNYEDGRASAWAGIKIPPLPIGEACSLASECAADGPVCGVSHPPCGRTCTRTCSTDADCPAPFGCAVSQHLCRAIPYPDDVCP